MRENPHISIKNEKTVCIMLLYWFSAMISTSEFQLSEEAF